MEVLRYDHNENRIHRKNLCRLAGNGLAGIPEALRRPVGDILICSSVICSLNISDIPQGADYIARLDEAGFLLKGAAEGSGEPLQVLLDDFCQEGAAHYTINLAKSAMEVWSFSQREIRQFTKLKSLTWLSSDRLHLSCADFGEVYTGGYGWEDYTAAFHIRPECPGSHMVNVRVKGAIRSYAAGFYALGKLGFYKNENDYVPPGRDRLSLGNRLRL